MNEIIRRINILSEYSFRLTVANASITLQLSDDETVDSSDFLQILENGSPLHDIVATRPIEKTYLEMKEQMIITYNDCISGIIDGTLSDNDILTKMIILSNTITARFRQNVDSRIRSNVICQLYRNNVKIN